MGIIIIRKLIFILLFFFVNRFFCLSVQFLPSSLLNVRLCFHVIHPHLIRWFKFTLKPPYSIACGKLRLAIWDTSFWTFWLKFGHKGP